MLIGIRGSKLRCDSYLITGKYLMEELYITPLIFETEMTLVYSFVC